MRQDMESSSLLQLDETEISVLMRLAHRRKEKMKKRGVVIPEWARRLWNPSTCIIEPRGDDAWVVYDNAICVTVFIGDTEESCEKFLKTPKTEAVFGVYTVGRRRAIQRG